VLNRHLIAPALLAGPTPVAVQAPEGAPDLDADGLRALANDLSHMVPHLDLVQAVAYRLRRNYGYLLMVVLCAWILKLEMHPTSAASLAELIRRAAIGPLPGAAVAGAALLLSLAFCALAVTGPSEQMRDWTELPSPIVRLRSLRVPGRGRDAPPEPGTSAAHPAGG
jgi:hypothetical protein